VLPWKSKRLELWVSPTQTTLSLQNRGSAEVLAQVARGNEDDLSSHFALCLQALPAQRCGLHIVLDDALVKFWKVVPPANTVQFDDLGAAARIRFEALHDLPVSEWTIQADWNAREPFLACAVPAHFLTALGECLNKPKSHRTKVIACTPAFIHCWNRHQPHMANSVQGLGVVNETTVTIAIIQNAKLIETRCFPLPDVRLESLQGLDQAIQNWGVQLDRKIPELMWLTGRLSRMWRGCKTDRINWRCLIAQGAA
jgi:hypothetical protein